MADEVVQTPYGKFFVDPDDCIGGTLKAGTLWDGPGFLQPIAREYARFGEEGTTVIDIGANFGSFTVYCAFMGAWRVIAVEPMPETLRYLRATLDLNQVTCATSVVLLPFAAYDTECDLWTPDYSVRNIGGASVFPIDQPEHTPNGTPLIEGKPLDQFQSLFGERVSLIKVDAQGSDFRALVGLRQTIERDHPAIVFEWEDRLANPRGDYLHQLLAWLTDRGYETIQWPSHLSNYLAVWQGDPSRPGKKHLRRRSA